MPAVNLARKAPRPILANFLALGFLGVLLSIRALAQAGLPDPLWTCPTLYHYGQLIPQPDGRILLASPFTFWGAPAVGEPIARRINADGSADPTFSAAWQTQPAFQKVRLQPDGKLLIFGPWSLFDQTPVFVRLNADGSRDPAFDSREAWAGSSTVPDLLVCANGDIFLFGTFQLYQNIPISKPFRLKADGTFDPSFQSGRNPNLVCSAMADGGPAGIYAALIDNDQSPRPFTLVRLRTDGSLDESFSVVVTDNVVHQILPGTHGHWVIEGDFSQVNGEASQSVAVIDDRGIVTDPNPIPAPLPHAGSLALVLHDGSLLLQRQFEPLPLTLIRPDGVRDPSFATHPDPEIGNPLPWLTSIAEMPDGRLIASHRGSTEQSHGRVIRLTGPDYVAPRAPQFPMPLEPLEQLWTGNMLFLTSRAVSDSPLRYQWLHNGLPIVGEISPDLWIPDTKLSSAGLYTLVATDDRGLSRTTSTQVIVRLRLPPPTPSVEGWEIRIPTERTIRYRVESAATPDAGEGSWVLEESFRGSGQEHRFSLSTTSEPRFWRVWTGD